MKKEQINETIETKEEIQETEQTTTEVAPVEEKPNLLTKVSNGLKKHGKKVAVGAAVTALGVVGYVLGRKSVLKHSDYDEFDLGSEGTEDDNIVADIDIDVTDI